MNSAGSKVSREIFDDSRSESPSLGSSTDTVYSDGMFSNHFSDSTDSEQTTARESFLPALPSLLRTKREEMPPSLNSIQIDECKIPLLEATQCKEKLNGYIKIPGNNAEKQKGRYSFVSSSELSDICMKPSYGKDKQNSFVTIFAVWNTIMGSSLLTMAWGIERAGLLPGIVLMMIMGGLCLFTSYVLLNVCYHHGDSDDCEVSDLCRMLLGRWAEVIAHIFSVIVMLGANIVYWVLMTNFLYHSVNYFKEMPFNDTQSLNDPYGGVMCPRHEYANITLTDVNVEISKWGGRYWDLYSSVPIYVAVIIFPLLNFRSSSFFTKFNSLGTLSVVYLVLFVIIKGAGWGLHIESWAAEIVIRTDFSVLSGMLALSFYIHNIIITVMRSNKRQENNGRDLSIAFVLVTLTYILVGAVFYICFPLAKTCIEDNILNNFVKSDILTAVARILLLFQVITVYPLIAYMLRIQLLGTNESKINNTYSIMIFNLAMITICIIFACFVPRIGTIIRYTGALSGLIHVFTLPSLLQITSLYKRGKLTVCKIIFYFSIFLIGACNLLAQFFVED